MRYFLTVNNLVKFRNTKKYFQIPKYDVGVPPSVKLQLPMSSQRVDMIIIPCQFLRLNVIQAILPFCIVSTCFL